MNKLFARIWIPLASVAVMIITACCLLAFYIALFFRRIFVKDFTTNAERQSCSHTPEKARIESATSQINAIQRKFEKGSVPSSQPKTI